MMTVIMIDHLLPHRSCQSAAPLCAYGVYALRMKITNISTAKMIEPEIVKTAIRSLIILVPFLPSGSTSLFI